MWIRFWFQVSLGAQALPNSLCILQLAFNMGIPIKMSILLGFAGYLLNLLVMSGLAWQLAFFFLGFAGGFLISFLISGCFGPVVVLFSVLHALNVFVFLVVLPAWLMR